jgi:hypothetical protein
MKHFFPECETRSVTPTSELADKHTDIDEDYAAAVAAVKKFATTTKTRRITTTVYKRA